MRIIGGTFRSRKLVAPRGNKTRPTTDRVRESLFNLLSTRIDLEGAHVLDLFAGSGALGLEAISRGAGHVTFVDTDREATRTVDRNAASLGVRRQTSVVCSDVSAFLKHQTTGAFDLILADPPYQFPMIQSVAAGALEHLAEGGVLAVEHGAAVTFDALGERIDCSRRYGRTIVTIFQ